MDVTTPCPRLLLPGWETCTCPLAGKASMELTMSSAIVSDSSTVWDGGEQPQLAGWPADEPRSGLTAHCTSPVAGA
jgi:hypothetical protein